MPGVMAGPMGGPGGMGSGPHPPNMGGPPMGGSGPGGPNPAIGPMGGPGSMGGPMSGPGGPMGGPMGGPPGPMGGPDRLDHPGPPFFGRRHPGPYFNQPDYRIYELNKRLQQRTEVVAMVLIFFHWFSSRFSNSNLYISNPSGKW